jgi:hypothetical protein
MKKFLMALLFVFNVGQHFAQITIPASTFPAANDTLRYARDDNPAPNLVNILTPPGFNQQWDLSTINLGATYAIRYLPANTGVHSAKFPGASLVVINPGNESYYKLDNTRFEFMGLSGKDPWGLNLDVTIHQSPSLIERRAPLNFFDINQVANNITLSLPIHDLPENIRNNIPGVIQADSFRIRSSLNRLDVVDAFGILKIPSGQYNVLREKRTEYHQSSLDIYTFLGWVDATQVLTSGLPDLFRVDTMTRYHFFNDREKEEIAIVTLNSDQSGVSSIQVKSNSQVSTDIKTSSNGGIYIHAFPNPAAEWLNFECRNMPSDSYTIKIFSLHGQEVWKGTQNLSGNKTIRITLHGFKNGTYLYRITNKNGTVLDAKTLLVLKP